MTCLKRAKRRVVFLFILDAQGTRVWQQLPQLSTRMTGCPSTIVTWLHGCSAQVIFMVLCAKPIPVRPGRWALVATCPPTTAANAIASCRHLARWARYLL